jgi:formyltetrahydrofolate deformylase
MLHRLLVSCRDKEGLIYGVSGVLFKHGLNIIENSEFVDHNSGHFFMRTEIEGKLDKNKILGDLAKALPEKTQLEIFEANKKKVVVFVTKESHCLGDLLVRHAFSQLDVEVLAVISQYDVLKDFVKKFEIPFYCIPVKESRDEHEDEIIKCLKKFQPEYLILAKYMRVFSDKIVSLFENKIVNIHHSFLPAFAGAKPYQQAYERGVKIIGATAHFVNNELDQGPIITQSTAPVDHRCDALKLSQIGKDVETLTLANALKLVFDDRVLIHNNRTIIL